MNFGCEISIDMSLLKRWGYEDEHGSINDVLDMNSYCFAFEKSSFSHVVYRYLVHQWLRTMAAIEGEKSIDFLTLFRNYLIVTNGTSFYSINCEENSSSNLIIQKFIPFSLSFSVCPLDFDMKFYLSCMSQILCYTYRSKKLIRFSCIPFEPHDSFFLSQCKQKKIQPCNELESFQIDCSQKSIFIFQV